MDDDGDVDVLVTAYASGHYLYVSNGGSPPTFSSITLVSKQSATTLAAADMDNDGMLVRFIIPSSC